MKKLLALALAAMMLLGLAACSSTGGTPSADPMAGGGGETESSAPEDSTAEPSVEPTLAATPAPTEVTVDCVDADGNPIQVNVPYNPQRVVVLDFATLDILDNLGLGDRIVGAPSITIDYLSAYKDKDGITNVGSVKTPSLEDIMACEPDIIFMGGRMAEYYEDLKGITPAVVRLICDNPDGLVESVRSNAKAIGSIFGADEQVDAILASFDSRIAALAEFAQGKNAMVGMCTSGSFNVVGNDGRCSIIGNEIGFENLAGDVVTSTHGNEASFELVVQMDPDYIFVMDRDAAISSEGAQLAQEIMENELVMSTRCYQDGHLVILAHPAVWYTGEGGITALDYMLQDLESALL